jgi:hypothetical protein
MFFMSEYAINVCHRKVENKITWVHTLMICAMHTCDCDHHIDYHGRHKFTILRVLLHA